MVEHEERVNIGLIGPDRLGTEGISRLNRNSELDINFIVLDQKIRGRQELLEIIPNENFYSLESDFFKKARNGIVLADFLDLKLKKYQGKLDITKSFFCNANFLNQKEGLKLLFETARRKNILICFDLPLRFTRAFLELNENIKKGSLGKISQIDLTFYKNKKLNKNLCKSNKTNFYGAFMDTGIHMLDIALKVLNYPEISYLNAIPYKNGKKIERILPPLCEDYFLVTLITKTGILINLRCSTNLPQSKPQVMEADFHGEKGLLSLRNNGDKENDLIVQQFRNQDTQIISSPPDVYVDAASKEWIWSLKTDKRYNVQTETEMLALSDLVNKIYTFKTA
ncbi:Gfo/Idh/MocA family oxidoreductase [Salegentibacter sp. Hel_I_6]|uniref:Gfo/Idh/MocA family protein n=1 Tax=Salegentibacter sp. Hel_I_6 TaxID=1250278 RepID=UPI0012E02DFB|nr:Gfo/Idh/MocA family oxidoreductase [Salegentibacter sp. Hel_I_6]